MISDNMVVMRRTLLHLLFWFTSFVECERLLQTVTASIGGGNYTNYRLSTTGRLMITLDSVQGDADLYISDQTLSPTYIDYVIQANSCGKEEVEISSHLKRPIGISVYGHPNFDMSEYRLSIYYIAARDDADYAELDQLFNRLDDEEEIDAEYSYQSQSKSSSTMGDQDEGESVWSVIGAFLSLVLKIVFEILL